MTMEGIGGGQSYLSRERRGDIVRRQGTVTIAEGATLSGEFLMYFATGGVVIQLPTIDTATVAVLGSLDGSTFYALESWGGTPVTVASSTGQKTVYIPEAAGLYSLKLQAGAAQNSGAVVIPIVAYDAA